MKNVLVADDNAIVRRHLRGLLERDACLVQEAADGVEVMEHVKTEAWDALFLDLQMPRLDGFGVLRELTRLGIKLPVVLITSSESSAEIVTAYKLGAKDYLLKPFREDQVRRAMQLVAGLDYTTVHRTGCDVALLDPDESSAMSLRAVLPANDVLDHAETVQGVPDALLRKHQLVLVGAWEQGPKERADEAEALGDLVSQRDPDAALVRLLAPGEALPDVTVFHAAVPRNDEAQLKGVVQAVRSGAVVSSGRRLRALRYAGSPELAHLYWWTLQRSARTALEKLYATGTGAVVVDLSLAPENPAARQELEQTLGQEAEARMFKLRFSSGVEHVTRIAPALVTSQATVAVDAEALVRGPTRVAEPTPAPPAAPTLVGAPVIPGYEVGELLGEGGMSRVFRATQRSLRRQVGVKMMRRELLQEQALEERFTAEGIALAALRHPNIVSVLDVGRTDDGQLYMIMEYVDGGDLRQLLEREGRLPVAECLTLGAQLLSGLAEAHGSGIIHRDIKPSNVLVAALKDGSRIMKLVDFGIAKLVQPRSGAAATRHGVVVGTPGYMAPEQLLGMEVSAASDLYAFGIVLFEMLTGRRPFVARDEFELAQLTMLTPAPRLRELLDQPGPAGLDELIAALLAKNPKDRPQSAADVKARLVALAADRAA